MPNQEFGQRLRELRKAKGLTKEALCDDESKLSVRQLTRLESGRSQPKLETLEYLARRLDVAIADLLGEHTVSVKLPENYLKLKYQLMHTPTYDNKDVLASLEETIDFILDHYYDNLPADEQMAIDIFQSKIYTYISEGHEKYGLSILKKNLQRLRENRLYNVNDLLLIQLYQASLGNSEEVRSDAFDKETFDIISKNLMQSMENIEGEYLFLLRDALLMIPAIEHERKEFCHIKQVLQQLNQIMEITQDFQKKPLVLMLEAEYLYFVEKDISRAEEVYQDAITLAKLLGNEFLAEKIAEEKKKDWRFKKS